MEYLEGAVNLAGSKTFAHTSITVVSEAHRKCLILDNGSHAAGIILYPQDVRDIVRALQIPFVLLTDPVVVGLVQVRYYLMKYTNTHGVLLSALDLGGNNVSVFVGEDDIPGLQAALDGQDRSNRYGILNR